MNIELSKLQGKYKVGSHLTKIESPRDLRKLFSKDELPLITEELRQYIIDVISEIGNSHFSASLGVIELTVALHYVYNTPYDLLVWDVGHQAYGHKILTGRRDVFPTNRQLNGICGFPRREESEYDAFGVGHSSTSISALLGMAMASYLNHQDDKRHVAVIGDGAMTAGLAFEGLNNMGAHPELNLLLVLNDNGISIDPDVGALMDHLKSLREPKGGQNLFEALNFQYFGPVDGHNVIELVETLQKIKDIPGPKILHCITKKGKGYKYSEEGNPSQWHAPGIFDKNTGKILNKKSEKPHPVKFQDVFGNTLVELAEKNDKIVGITAAMPTGTSMKLMMDAFPKRTFDVGIAEQHAVTFSAGLATQGYVPFCALYSTFLQRAYDQLIHDVALQDLPVVFCIDRAGIVGADGATHHGAFDLAYLRAIPNMIISAPMDESELRNLMFTAQKDGHKHPFAIRYPRGEGVMIDWKTPMKAIPIGKGRIINKGSDISIISIGTSGNTVQKAVTELKRQGIYAAHFDMRFVKPIDEELLHYIMQNYSAIITVEDGCITGGLGSAVAEFIVENGYSSSLRRLGIPDHFVLHGSQSELIAQCGYDVEGIIRVTKEILDK